MSDLAKIGIGSGIGILLGIVLVLWVDPNTGEGAVVLIGTSVVFCTVCGGIFAKIRSAKSRKAK